MTTANVGPGAQVLIANPTVMEKWEGRSLKRSFDRVVFGSLEAPGAADATGEAASAMSRPMHGAGAALASAPVAVKVAKASGPEGRTVAEVVAGRAAQKDEAVVVRRQVVKLSAGIMGKNRVHLRDGPGSDADGSHDLLATTQDKPMLGDIVSAHGTVRTDVTLGSGYSYVVMMEDAVLKK